MSAGRGVDHEIRRGNIAGSANRLERRVRVLVEIEIQMADLADVFLGTGFRTRLDWIHSDKNVASLMILCGQPLLEGFAGSDVRLARPDS